MQGKYNNAHENPSPFIHSEKEEEDPRKISHNSNGSPDARNITGTTMVSNQKENNGETNIVNTPPPTGTSGENCKKEIGINGKILTDSEDYENNYSKIRALVHYPKSRLCRKSINTKCDRISDQNHK